MRKLFFAALLLLFVGASAHQIEAKPFIQVEAKAVLTDSIVKSAVQVNPVVVNALTKDTAYQFTWTAFDLSRDTTKGCNTYVAIYNRQGNNVHALNVPIPASVVNKWGTDDKVIDDYILSFLGLTRRQQ